MGRRKPQLSPLHPRYWPSWIGVVIVWLIGQLPLPVLLMMGRGLGTLFLHLAGSRRATAETNIRLCFPELDQQQQQRLARDTINSLGQALCEITASYCNQRLDLEKHFTFKGLEHVQRAIDAGQGVLMIGMHFNTLDIAARALALKVPYSSVYRPNDNPAVEWLISRGRGAHSQHYIRRADTRLMVKLLRSGEPIWYAPDQDYGRKHSVFVPFFGHPAATITGTSRLARLGKAQVIPVAHYRQPGARYLLEFGPPLDNFPGSNEEEDAERINSVIEQAVRISPEQYLWVHRRFKHQPEGQKNPYR